MEIVKPGFVELGPERRGFLALPEGAAPRPAVLVFQEAFGVNAYVRKECQRLADAGFAALAPDLYRGQTFDYAERDAAIAKLRTLSDDDLLADVRAALGYLAGREDVSHNAYGAIGFCMGGRLAFLCALEFGPKFAAAACFYGGGIAPAEPSHGQKSLLARVSGIDAELYLAYGADDPSIAPDEHARIAHGLSTAKKRYTLAVFPEAGHAFASTDRPTYREVAAEEALSEAFDLFHRKLAGPVTGSVTG